MKKLKQTVEFMRNNWNSVYGTMYNRVSVFTVGLAVLVTSKSSHAAPKAVDPSKFFEQVIEILTGKIATSLAVIAVILLGLSAMFGMFDTRKAGMIILGIVLVFGAAWFVDQLTTG